MRLQETDRLPGFRKLESQIGHNSKLKLYPDGNHNLTVASKPIFKKKGWESAEWKEKVPKPQNPNGEVRDDSVRRAKQKVFDIARLILICDK
jgi:hypothetical protein